MNLKKKKKVLTLVQHYSLLLLKLRILIHIQTLPICLLQYQIITCTITVVLVKGS